MRLLSKETVALVYENEFSFVTCVDMKINDRKELDWTTDISCLALTLSNGPFKFSSDRKIWPSLDLLVLTIFSQLLACMLGFLVKFA